MNKAPFNYDDTDCQNIPQYAVMEQINNNNIDYNHNEMQGDNINIGQKKPQLIINGERGNSNKNKHQNQPNGNNQ